VKKLSLVLFALLVTAAAGSAFATCPTSPSFYTVGGASWVDWTQDISCYSVDSSITTAYVNCYGAIGWKYNSAFVSTAATSFTPNSTQVYNANNWYATTHVDFTSPSASAYDYIALWAVVTHPNGQFTQTSLFFWSGTSGSHSGCPEVGGSFSASAGDTVTIMLQGVNGSGTATIRAGVPHISNSF
jgi:hypothetical protein